MNPFYMINQTVIIIQHFFFIIPSQHQPQNTILPRYFQSLTSLSFSFNQYDSPCRPAGPKLQQNQDYQIPFLDYKYKNPWRMFSHQNQMNSTPLGYAFGDNSRADMTAPLNVQMQPNPFNTDYMQPSPQPMIGAFPPPVFLAPNFDNQITAALSPNIQPIVPNNMGGTVYYGTLDTETCANVQAVTKLPGQTYKCLLVLNIILFVAVILGILVLVKFNIIVWTVGQIIGIPYFIYFFNFCCKNPITQIGTNTKTFSEMATLYQQMQRQTGHLKLTAQCYHYTKGKRRRKVVSHTATEILTVRSCVDISEPLANIQGDAKYLLCNINKFYYFEDVNSHVIFCNVLNNFKANNKKDLHQTYYHALDIQVPGLVGQVAVSDGNTGCLRPLFYVFLILGLGYPYVKYVDSLTQRYSINLVKRLAL